MSEVGAIIKKKVGYTMKVLNTYICKHKIDGNTVESRVIAVLESMEKDGNTYEYIKTYKLDKDCPSPANGTVGKLLFTFGKNPRVGAIQINAK